MAAEFDNSNCTIFFKYTFIKSFIFYIYFITMGLTYKSGLWTWDNYSDGIVSVSHNGGPKHKHPMKQSSVMDVHTKLLGGNKSSLDIKFRDSVDVLRQIQFRRHLQRRRMRSEEEEVVMLQDIKDVVLFQVLSPLPAKFIDFFHTNTVDRFLRALIVYFQYFLQAYDEMLLRHLENLHKLHHPNILKIENKMQETLSELRGMVGREYTSILLGCDEVKKFHHMANRMNTSQGEQDVRLFELLYRMCTRVVWIALQRRCLNLIELELNRLFRTDEFNVVKHQKGPQKSFSALDRFPHEDRILSGEAMKEHRRLLLQSPAIAELIRGSQDYRLLGTGYVQFDTNDQKIVSLQQTYTTPEEALGFVKMVVGILGLPKKNFDAMLVQRMDTQEMRMIKSKTMIKATAHKLSYVKEAAKQYVEFELPEAGVAEPIPAEFPHSNYTFPSTPPDDMEASRLKWRKYMAHMQRKLLTRV